MPTMKTPGVYIVEKSAFPNSVVGVATAVPAFIGYTEKAEQGAISLLNKPFRISSMAEYQRYFGEASKPKFTIDYAKAGEAADFIAPSPNNTQGDAKKWVPITAGFILYQAMQWFYNNGGGDCYIVSVGHYDKASHQDGLGEITAAALIGGINTLVHEQAPTMLIVPEATSLADSQSCASVQQAAIDHCGYTMRNRVAILDIYYGDRPRNDPAGDCIAEFRHSLGSNNLDFAAAYYPWLHTTLIEETAVGLMQLSQQGKAWLIPLLKTELKLDSVDDIEMQVPKAGGKPAPSKAGLAQLAQRAALKKQLESIQLTNDTKTQAGSIKGKKSKPAASVDVAAQQLQLHSTLLAISPLYKTMVKSLAVKLNVMPPAAAMAGIYTAVDSQRGVWKAPANVSLASVVSPTVSIDHNEQEDLNVHVQGRSINTIREFTGKGTLVWGARTLDSNNLEWRYINVRRTMIMLQESIRLAIKAYAFEPNNAATWVTINSMINNFLTNIWKQGGLAGATPDEAFSVLGETMTQQDINDDLLRVSVMVAITRPAEFMVFDVTQQMQSN